MKTALIVSLLLVWCVFLTCVLLMSPKWWIGLWIGGAAAWGNEYGSKKSMEWKLKLVAMISGIVFAWICLFLPFVG